jgi:imidazoleglycerol-phosphate dehydratase
MNQKVDAFGIRVKKLEVNEVEVVRRTAETEITCRISSGKKQKWNLDTGLHFFNHMLEELAYFSKFNIDTTVKSPHFLLTHTVLEDTGITLGRAFYELATTRGKRNGIRSFGSGIGILDEAYAYARISLEGRAGTYVTRHTRRFGVVEDVQEEFLESFFQGFAQGMKLTIQLDLMRADDPHHLWEACFRAFGCALEEALRLDEWKQGGIAGVKGTID